MVGEFGKYLLACTLIRPAPPYCELGNSNASWSPGRMRMCRKVVRFAYIQVCSI